MELGEGYKNDLACASFVSYIAKALREQLLASLKSAKFFSIQMDGSTDAGNMEEELFMAVFFDPRDEDGIVHVRNVYFCVRQPTSVNALGLYECFNKALIHVGIYDSSLTRLIGFGCDGASVNIGDNALKGLLQVDRPWLATVWCFSHRLELALTDSLKDTLFSSVDDVLLRLYYIYSKAPKKCRILDEVVTELQSCLESSEFPSSGGTRPLRSCGTRFILHKVNALERVLDRYGAYLCHIISLTEDPTTKSADKQKLKGYCKKWTQSKILLGFALFHDILKPAAILCKVLQSDELCIVGAIESLLRTTAAMEKLKDMQLNEFPSIKKVLQRINQEDTIELTYQGVTITHYPQGMTYLQNNYTFYIDAILRCLHQRLKPQNYPADVKILTCALTIIATHGWEKTDDAGFGYDAIECLTTRFVTPLEEASVNISLIQGEWEDVVFYATQYINLVTNSYKVVWWKLFNSPDATRWQNILALVELLFTIPLSNSCVERSFSHLKTLKTDRRASLKEDHLDDLLRIKLEGPPLQQWDSRNAIELWWNDKTCRINVKDFRASRTTTTQEPKENWPCVQLDNFSWELSDWDSWMESELEDTNTE